MIGLLKKQQISIDLKRNENVTGTCIHTRTHACTERDSQADRQTETRTNERMRQGERGQRAEVKATGKKY